MYSQIRIHYVYNPSQKIDTIRVSTFRDLKNFFFKINHIKSSKAYILCDNYAEKLSQFAKKIIVP